MPDLFETHRDLLTKAVEASLRRDYWSPFAEVPSAKFYGESAKGDGEAAFEAYCGSNFVLAGHPGDGWIGGEVSPYGKTLNVNYPKLSAIQAVTEAQSAGREWAGVSVEDRVGICLEIINRLNKRSFEIANAVHHTTGQAFIMAFQAAAPHAQDRAVEAVAYAYEAMTRTPKTARWEKPVGKGATAILEKSWRVQPRGVALTIGCATFPTWNSYPGIFASLATGNSVIVKPHPSAILPLAITVEIGREVLKQEGLDPNILILAADEAGSEITKDLVPIPGIGIIDFTGSSAFGSWIRQHAGRDVALYTEEAGVNSIIVDSTDNFRGMCGNIAASLSLYSGQMCTAPQNIFVPRDGIATDDGHKTFDEVASGLAKATDGLLSDPARAAGFCGAIANPSTLERIAEARSYGEIVRDSHEIEGQEGARTATPLIIKLDGDKSEAHLEERFGPISFIIETNGTQDSIDRASSSAKTIGAISASLYSTDEGMISAAEDAFAVAGVTLSVNLTGAILVNQNAAFSDFHVTGANPAGNACLTDAAFVEGRFRMVGVRRAVAA